MPEYLEPSEATTLVKLSAAIKESGRKDLANKVFELFLHNTDIKYLEMVVKGVEALKEQD